MLKKEMCRGRESSTSVFRRGEPENLCQFLRKTKGQTSLDETEKTGSYKRECTLFAALVEVQ